jgi:hypothetical protein
MLQKLPTTPAEQTFFAGDIQLRLTIELSSVPHRLFRWHRNCMGHLELISSIGKSVNEAIDEMSSRKSTYKMVGGPRGIQVIQPQVCTRLLSWVSY